MFTDWVRSCPLLMHVALNMYLVVISGVTTRLPGVMTPSLEKSPPSRNTPLALVTALQFKVTDCPGPMEVALASNVKLLGCPEQVLGAVVGVRVTVGAIGVGGTGVA